MTAFKQGLSQSVRLGQEMKINPRLYQAMDMLYMPLLDLQQHLKQELEINPFLEMNEESEEGETEEDGAEGEDDTALAVEDVPLTTVEDPRKDDGTDWEEILLNGFDVGNGVREEHEESEGWTPTSVAAHDLADHLREQIAHLDLTEREKLIADEVIGNIGDDGYLQGDLAGVRDGINAEIRRSAAVLDRDEDDLPLITDAEVEAMLARIQRLDPSGVGARDLRECLLIQLREAGETETMPVRLVRDFFDELVAHKWSDIARRTGVVPADVQRAADRIALLNPKPGRLAGNAQEQYVIPDLIVEKVDGQYLVFLNDGNLPRLKLSRVYQDIARDRKKFDGESRDFINSKLNAAQWLIQAIEQRRNTMLKVMHFIVDRQRDFFEKGVKALKPLTLREVADVIGMHESTVSRVTNEKYAQTPRGVLPLKFFFSSALATTGGEDASARAIRATIESLVQAEDPKAPLTDQAIVERLEADGIQIARRTVAKYRDQLGVLPARMRKRL
ncbi:MAG: RNA polymerase factor sigma-54 [Gemmatimonadaceae bacterium]|nr:RNA polymerase factor sigma-54 [Gemmatimonadaceae bacterium]